MKTGIGEDKGSMKDRGKEGCEAIKTRREVSTLESAFLNLQLTLALVVFPSSVDVMVVLARSRSHLEVKDGDLELGGQWSWVDLVIAFAKRLNESSRGKVQGGRRDRDG